MKPVPRYHRDIILQNYPLEFVVNTGELWERINDNPQSVTQPRWDYSSLLLELHYGEFVDGTLEGISCWSGRFMHAEIILRPWDMESPGSALSVFFELVDSREAAAFKLIYC